MLRPDRGARQRLDRPDGGAGLQTRREGDRGPLLGYASQKNRAPNTPSTIGSFHSDADEALSEALEGEIWNVKKRGPSMTPYTVPRLAKYMGPLDPAWRLVSRPQGAAL